MCPTVVNTWAKHNNATCSIAMPRIRQAQPPVECLSRRGGLAHCHGNFINYYSLPSVPNPHSHLKTHLQPSSSGHHNFCTVTTAETWGTSVPNPPISRTTSPLLVGHWARARQQSRALRRSRRKSLRAHLVALLEAAREPQVLMTPAVRQPKPPR